MENVTGRLEVGHEPPNPQALIPYFATPQEGADYVELLEARQAAAQPKGRVSP